jgi:hypothetical protein
MADRFVSPGGREIFAGLAQFTRWALFPYGRWTCADGREVLFNRLYEPLWERLDGLAPSPARATEWVPDIVQQIWFYSDNHAEAAKRKRASAAAP